VKPRTWELHRDIVRNHLVSALGHLLLQQLAGARHIRLHDLRHTWATLALQAKVPTRGGAGAAGARLDCYHARHLPALRPRHGRAGRGDRGRALVMGADS
jgi:integrase